MKLSQTTSHTSLPCTQTRVPSHEKWMEETLRDCIFKFWLLTDLNVRDIKFFWLFSLQLASKLFVVRPVVRREG